MSRLAPIGQDLELPSASGRLGNNPPLEYAPLFRSSINEDPRPRHRTNLGIGIRPPGGEGLLPHNWYPADLLPP